MAEWKFTDQYGTDYPALANSVLSVLVFDVTGESPVTGTAFAADLDLAATGTAMAVLSKLTGMNSIPMSGTVTTDNDTLDVKIEATNVADLLAAFSKVLPIIGTLITKAGLGLTSTIPKDLTADDDPPDEEFDLSFTVTVGSGSGAFSAGIPMSDGLFHADATFEDFGIGLSDLDFLVPGSDDFGAAFPSTQLGPYYESNTKLELLSMAVSFHVSTDPELSVIPNDVGVSIGITDIPLYEQALFLDPLAVQVTVADIDTTPVPNWGLEGLFVLTNYKTPGNTADPDFTFDLQMGFPNPPENPDFTVSGNFANPADKSVALIISDLLGQETDIGIADDITLEKFDFFTDADVTTGKISDFEFDIEMDGEIGLFASLELTSFSISVSYSGS